MRKQTTVQTIAKLSFPPIAGGVLQRACACGQHIANSNGECEECWKKRQGALQRAAMSTIPVNQTPPIVYEVLRSPGQPLDARTLAFMEQRFDHDFSNVRVHTDAQASVSAQAVNALAYTVGRNVVFGTNQYRPETNEGKKLIAHELTHTMQQASRTTGVQSRLEMVTQENPAEREAEAASREVLGLQHIRANTRHDVKVARQVPPMAGPQPVQAACPVAPITPITDQDALNMENGARVIWNNTTPGLQASANRLVALIRAEPGGTATITSAYRPQAYQDHLREVWDKARALQNNNSPQCAAVRAAVNQEMTNHALAVNRPVARISNHRAGNAVDIDWDLPNAANEETRIDALAAQAGLVHRLHAADRPHFEI